MDIRFLQPYWHLKIQICIDWKKYTCFERHQSGNSHKYTGGDVKGMLGFAVDHIYAVLGDQIFKRFASNPMVTYCVPLLQNLPLYSYEAEFIQNC
jgi:hypothetical protein